jgi:hypothetical protein
VLIKRLPSRLARSRLQPFIRLGKTIRKHRDGILAAIRLGINQGRTEALNSKVRLIWTAAPTAFTQPRPRSRWYCSLAARSPFTSHTSYTPSGSRDTDHINAERGQIGGSDTPGSDELQQRATTSVASQTCCK